MIWQRPLIYFKLSYMKIKAFDIQSQLNLGFLFSWGNKSNSQKLEKPARFRQANLQAFSVPRNLPCINTLAAGHYDNKIMICLYDAL